MNNVGGGATALDRIKDRFTDKQFDLISKFLTEKPKVTILSGG